MVSLFRYIRWLSLDIALGGAILVLFVGEQFQLEIGIPIQSAVFLSIWIIYTIDHMRDANRMPDPSMGRHKFHKKEFRSIRWLLGIMIIGGLINLYYLPLRIIVFGIAIVGIVLIYFIVQKKLLLVGAKELVIAIIYSISMFLYPMSIIQFGSSEWLMLAELTLLAYSNLLLISMIEWEQDQQDKTDSIMSFLSKRSVRLLVFLILVFLGFVASYQMIAMYNVYQLFILLASCVYLLIAMLPERLKKNERYRWLSDAVFLFPIFL